MFFPQPHGNVGRASYNAFPESVCKHAVSFIKNYAKVHGLPMPAAPRGRAQDAPTYLRTSAMFVAVHAAYKNVPTIGCKSFTGLWHDSYPDIKFMQRREDVCVYCERFWAESSAARSEEGRVKCLSVWQAHIQPAQDERRFYNDCASRAISAEKSGNTPVPYTHLTFDFSENFALPYHARQPGPVYFKVLLRVNDFGVMNEERQQQRQYLYTKLRAG